MTVRLKDGRTKAASRTNNKGQPTKKNPAKFNCENNATVFKELHLRISPAWAAVDSDAVCNK